MQNEWHILLPAVTTISLFIEKSFNLNEDVSDKFLVVSRFFNITVRKIIFDSFEEIELSINVINMSLKKFIIKTLNYLLRIAEFFPRL